jgi:class 3 adenylate cyclase
MISQLASAQLATELLDDKESHMTQLAAPPRARERGPRTTSHRIDGYSRVSSAEPDRERAGIRRYRWLAATGWIVASILPLIGLVSLFLRRQLDPAWDSPRLHFVLFLAVGAGAVTLAYLAGQAADRRGDARVFLLSLAFLATGGFLAVHAIGTPGILLHNELPGFKVAIPAGMVIGSVFAAWSAFIDVRPRSALAVVRHRHLLRRAVFVAIAIWALFSLAELPPLAGASAEGGGTFLRVLASVGAVVYGASAIRYLVAFRGRMTLLPASVVGCFVLVGEALVGSALVGERTWHASWWEWHALIVTAYLIVVLAARNQWREERFRNLYLPATRERVQEVSVLFADLVGSTTFAEQSSPQEVATMLSSYYGMATPLISERFGGNVEKFMGDAIMATFNSRGDQPDHAQRAAVAGLELQRAMQPLTERHPSWPKLRVGVNTGDAMVRELGGPGHIVYAVVGDMMNVGSRLQGLAPVGGVLIGADTYRRLGANADVEPRPGLVVKGKQSPVDAYILKAVPTPRIPKGRHVEIAY